MSKRMVHLYSTDICISQFATVYIINPSLRVNRVFREQVIKFLNDTIYEK